MTDEAGQAPAEDISARLQQLEETYLALWHKLESRKLDLLMQGSSPRGVFIRDEAKAILNQLVEVRKQFIRLRRDGREAPAPVQIVGILGEPKTVAQAGVSVPTDRPPPSEGDQ